MTPKKAFAYPIQRARRLELAPTADRRAWWLLVMALGLIVMEGAIRKWVVGDADEPLKYLVYFSKDIIFGAVIFLPLRRPKPRALRVFRRWLLPGLILLILGAGFSTFRDLNPVGAVLTLRAGVFLPLVAFYAVRRIENLSLRHIAWFISGLTILNFAMAVLQNSLPADHVLNRYASGSLNIAVMKSGVRATGTFSYIAGLGVLSIVGIWAGMVLVSLGERLWHRITGWATIACGFGCGLAAVSRAPIVIGAAMVLIWLLFSLGRFPSFFRNLFACALLLGLVASLEVAPTFVGLGEGLIDRQENAGDSFTTRAVGQLEECLTALSAAPLGAGLGTEQTAGNYFKGGVMRFTSFETQLPRLVMETGFLGLVGFLLICAGAIWALQAAKHDFATARDRSALLATQLLLLPLFYTNVIFNHTASAFVWMIFAAVMAAEKKARSYDGGRGWPATRIPVEARVQDTRASEARSYRNA